MKNVEYIIVGDGYAALFFAHQLIKNKKSFVLFSGGKKSASHISAGIINPLVLKRFTRFWLAQEQINALHETLNEIENYTKKNYWVNEPIHRILHDEMEREVWSKKSKREDLKPFLSQEFERFEEVKNPFGTGYVLQSGRLNVVDFFNDLFSYLYKIDSLISEFFNYDELNRKENIYQNFKFKHIVFAEGMAVRNNPFFKNIPLIPNKGHQFNLKLSENIGNKTFKKKYFFFPMSENNFYYGGTHDRDHLEDEINQDSVEDLKNSLEDFYKNEYEVSDINFAFRATVEDRRPILGRHELYENLYILNGLGARGILNGNYFAKDLFNFIENGKPLMEEVDLKRFF
ncbi:NAD(P)/FAD-dependent oxidoreductase [Halpernia sp.]|uniref:NAD(P)/FAD-dependent oxidoreductase n=1 Tax=Halpernia sp. TaxID=2782209 RepID=UPI003A93C560